MTNTWTPVFEDRDGNRLVLMNTHYWAEDEAGARDIRAGCLMVECILLHLKALDVREFAPGVEVPNVEAYLPNRGGHFPVKVAVIAGPMLDAALAVPDGAA